MAPTKKIDPVFHVSIGSQKRMDINIYKKQVYAHIKDFGKDKSVSFNEDDLYDFFNKEERIKKIFSHLNKKITKENKTDQKSKVQKKKNEKKQVIEFNDSSDKESINSDIDINFNSD